MPPLLDTQALTRVRIRGLRELLGVDNVTILGDLLSRVSLDAYAGGLVTAPVYGDVIQSTVNAAAFQIGWTIPPDGWPIRVVACSVSVYPNGPLAPPQTADELGIYMIPGLVPQAPVPSASIGAPTQFPWAVSRWQMIRLAHGVTTGGVTLDRDNVVLHPGDSLVLAGDGTAVGDEAWGSLGFTRTAPDCRPPR